MAEYIPREVGTTIRQPATANLMIDSKDRSATFSSPWNFSIVKNQSIQNGFFTRIGTTEVVLEWCQENIYKTDISQNIVGNNYIVVDICGTSLLTNQTIEVGQGFYTVAELIDDLVFELNDLSGTTGVSFTTGTFQGGELNILCSGGVMKVVQKTKLSGLLGWDGVDYFNQYRNEFSISDCIDLRLFRYIDFVSTQLTYNQDLKDNSTASINRDVLCRWYMAYDEEATLDAYGFPILMGYNKFVLRRLFNPPKQIKWNNTQPLGNLSFEVYGDDGKLVKQYLGGNIAEQDQSNWLMTLQISEN